MRYAEFLQLRALDQQALLGLAWGSLVDDPPAEFIRLPAPPMLMLDRVVEVTHDGARGRIVGERDVRLDDWFFQCHFVSDPVQPGCLGVDAVWQLVGLYCSLRGGQGSGRALGCKEVEFAGQIRRYTDLKASGTAMAIGTARVLVDGEAIYTVRDAKVGLFAGIHYTDYPRRSERALGGLMERD